VLSLRCTTIAPSTGSCARHGAHHRNDKTFLLSGTNLTYIPIGATHRIENPGKAPACTSLEVQSGSYLGEDDIVAARRATTAVKDQY